ISWPPLNRNRHTTKIWVCFSGASQYGSAPSNFPSCGKLRRLHGTLSKRMAASRRTQAGPRVAVSVLRGRFDERKEERACEDYWHACGLPDGIKVLARD